MKSVRRFEDPTPGLSDYLSVEREHPSWDGFRSHRSGYAYRELRDALVGNQRGLCGYCETSLSNTDIQIEHVVPRSAGARVRGGELAAGNMIACCTGRAKRWPEEPADEAPARSGHTCGQAKGDRDDADFLDPRDLPETPSLFEVDSEGRITPNERGCAEAGIPAARVTATIETLRLNEERLRRDRTDRWFALLSVWSRYANDVTRLRRAAKRELLPDASGRLRGFFTTARSYFGAAAETVLAEAPEEWV